MRAIDTNFATLCVRSKLFLVAAMTTWRFTHDGYCLCGFDAGLFRQQLGVDLALCAFDGRSVMNWLYLISGLISLALLVYLVYAMLFPEAL